MGKIIFIIFLLFPTILFSQNKKIVVEFDKNDSIKIKKREKGYSVFIYYEKNIEYNKNKEKRPLVDGRIICEGCKKEIFIAIVSKPKKRVKNIKIIPANEWKEKYNPHMLIFPIDYIKIDKLYYKYLGTVIE